MGYPHFECTSPSQWPVDVSPRLSPRRQLGIRGPITQSSGSFAQAPWPALFMQRCASAEHQAPHKSPKIVKVATSVCVLQLVQADHQNGSCLTASSKQAHTLTLVALKSKGHAEETDKTAFDTADTFPLHAKPKSPNQHCRHAPPIDDRQDKQQEQS